MDQSSTARGGRARRARSRRRQCRVSVSRPASARCCSDVVANAARNTCVRQSSSASLSCTHDDGEGFVAKIVRPDRRGAEEDAANRHR